MAKRNEAAVGERWAYRVGAQDEFAEVQITGPGDRDSQVKAMFLTGARAGWEGEVPITRLKALWRDRLDFLSLERAWRSLASSPDEIEASAVEEVVRVFLEPAASFNASKARNGTLTIFDEDIVDAVIGGGLDAHVDGAPSILEESGAAHYGWETTLAIVRQFCLRKGRRVMAYVHAEELRASSDMEQGPPHGYALYEEFLRPMWDLIREWCGRDVANVLDELRSQRAESMRLARLVELAAGLLHDAGSKAEGLALVLEAFPDVPEAELRLRIAHGSQARSS